MNYPCERATHEAIIELGGSLGDYRKMRHEHTHSFSEGTILLFADRRDRNGGGDEGCKISSSELGTASDEWASGKYTTEELSNIVDAWSES